MKLNGPPYTTYPNRRPIYGHAEDYPYQGDEDTMITVETARRIASEWHGGQSSPLYAFASSGTVLPGVVEEVEYDISAERHDQSVPKHEIDELVSLLEYLRVQVAYFADPKHGKSDDEPCQWCGARWKTTLTTSGTRTMVHNPRCNYVVWQSKLDG